MEWIINNLQFLIGDIIIPIITMIIGFFGGRFWEKHKAKAVIKGNNNNVFQNNTVIENPEKEEKRKKKNETK